MTTEHVGIAGKRDVQRHRDPATSWIERWLIVLDVFFKYWAFNVERSGNFLRQFLPVRVFKFICRDIIDDPVQPFVELPEVVFDAVRRE